MITLDEVKQWLRVDYDDEDGLMTALIATAVADIYAISWAEAGTLDADPVAKTAALWDVAYRFEHREDADAAALMVQLRAMLSPVRKMEF